MTATHSHDNHLHGVHSHGDVDERLLQAEHICAKEGLRLTPLRKEVLALILSANAPIGAYDLLAQLKHDSTRPAAPPTVYRSLDFLLEHGFIHRLTSINAFIPCCHFREGHQAAFIICQKCHAVKETSAHNLFDELESIARQDNFTALHSIIEISGICQQCQ